MIEQIYEKTSNVILWKLLKKLLEKFSDEIVKNFLFFEINTYCRNS